MKQYNLNKMQHRLKKYLDGKRFEHTMGVRYTCGALAMCYHCDLEKAQVAGLLHDCAKCISDEKKIEICIEQGIKISQAEQANPFLLHAKVGAYIARREYHVVDQEILDAITYHTTGRANMSLLEKITYIADYIEPLRETAPNLESIRALAFQDIDQAICVILKNTLVYLNNRKSEIDPLTQIAYEYYAKFCKMED